LIANNNAQIYFSVIKNIYKNISAKFLNNTENEVQQLSIGGTADNV